MSFTPGPWEVDSTVALGVWKMPQSEYESPMRICSVCPDSSDFTRESRDANARLIAAAPDLLAALQVLLAQYTELVNCGDCGNWNPEEEAEVIAARAAIAKATKGAGS